VQLNRRDSDSSWVMRFFNMCCMITVREVKRRNIVRKVEAQ
jgi:hypothetical protein